MSADKLLTDSVSLRNCTVLRCREGAGERDAHPICNRPVVVVHERGCIGVGEAEGEFSSTFSIGAPTTPGSGRSPWAQSRATAVQPLPRDGHLLRSRPHVRLGRATMRAQHGAHRTFRVRGSPAHPQILQCS